MLTYVCNTWILLAQILNQPEITQPTFAHVQKDSKRLTGQQFWSFFEKPHTDHKKMQIKEMRKYISVLKSWDDSWLFICAMKCPCKTKNMYLIGNYIYSLDKST